MNNTEDQLKEMLHSRVYKDGEWRTLKKKDQGPKDLSDQSLGDLLRINANGESYSVKKSPTKRKVKAPNGMIQEEDDDEERPQQRQSQKMRGSQMSDLERDPFEGDGKTYYDDNHVVGEQDGQKVLLIPFENSNVLDGLSTINQQKRNTENYPSPLEVHSTGLQKPVKGKKKKKKKKKVMSNLLADLDHEPIYENEPQDIPEYQLQNRPYKMENEEEQKKVRFQDGNYSQSQRGNQMDSHINIQDEGMVPQRFEGDKPKTKPKSKMCNIF